MMMDDIKLTYIPDSHGWIKVYLQAPNAELAEAWFNSFWNHNATSQDEPEWIFDNELAFCTTWDKMKKAMNDIFLFILLNDDEDAFKGEEGGAFYFYNSSTVSYGRLEFGKIWGAENHPGRKNKKTSMWLRTHTKASLINSSQRQ